MNSKRENLIVGLDIGTTKICAIVGAMTDDGLDVVGIGTSPSRGLRKGVVINIESTVNAIRKALQEAELMAGCEIKSVFAGIAGGHIKGINSQGVIAIKNREVTKEDIDRVIDAAKVSEREFEEVKIEKGVALKEAQIDTHLLSADVYLNVQGDEPEIEPESIAHVFRLLALGHKIPVPLGAWGSGMAMARTWRATSSGSSGVTR